MQKKFSLPGNTSTVLFMGRFQPFHRGHYETIRTLAQQYAKIIIGVGSSQEGFTLSNPFTAHEREEMIIRALKSVTNNVSLMLIPDIKNNNHWVAHVKKIVGKFDLAATNNPLVYQLFKQAAVPVYNHKLIQPHRYKATSIRELLAHKKNWQSLVPQTIATYLQTIHAEDRLKTLSNKRDPSDLLKTLNLTCMQPSLWKIAFTHTSFLHEYPALKLGSNERLEFLGDAVLELVITEFLYQTYITAEEGIMTTQRAALVRTEHLGGLALKLKFGEYLSMSFGEEKNGGRTNLSILANTFEAFIGALYLEHGLEAVQKFTKKYLLQQMPSQILSQETKDYKTKLQELLQEKYKTLPSYVLIKEEGAAHSKQFTFAVQFDNKILGRGVGKSKQLAQQQAAEQAYKNLIKKKKD